MSLDAWEDNALSSIASDLTASAPELTSFLSMFNRLAAGERMPEDPPARQRGGRGCRRARPRQRRLRGGKPGALMRAANTGAMPLVVVAVIMVVATTVSITLALVLGAASQAPGGSRRVMQCTGTWPVACQRG